MGYYLMIKKVRHNGFKYLCKCMDNKDHILYQGSGVFWRRVLAQHPDWIIDTEVLGHYDTKEELKEAGIYYSNKFDVVKSKEWANCMREEGDGGSTTKGTFAIHNPVTLQERFISDENDIPEGWRIGRKKRGKRSAETTAKISAKQTGQKRSEEVRQRMRDATRKPRKTVQCEYCDRQITLQNIKRHHRITHGKILLN